MRSSIRFTPFGLVLLGAALLAGSCASGDAPLEYTTVTFERTIEECRGAQSPCARVTLSYPEITHASTKGVRDSLNHGILRPLLQSIDIEGSLESPQALADELFFYYGRTVKEFPDYSAQWFIERSAEILLDSLSILTLQYSDHMYTGGAHPLRQEVFRLFDTRSGARIPADSLLAEGARAQLVALAERAFRHVREIPPGKGLNEAGFWFQSNRFALNENIGLTGRGLEIVFNPYEVAPYAMGSTRLVLPYDSLRGVLDLSRRFR
jgi:hypothetical protein